MADLAQLETALRNADAAGDVQAATILAGEIRKMRPAAVEAGQSINSIPRQIGLTARYGLEGLANTAQIVTEPIRAVTDRVFGQTGKTVPLGALATRAADAIGLPSPQTANERVVGDATRLVAGAGGLGAAANTARVLPGMAGQAGTMLSANMGQQLSSAAGAGLAGGSSREAGGSPAMQFGASMLGGVAGGMAPAAAGSAVNATKNVARQFMPNRGGQELDVTINAALQRAGYDYSQVPERVRQSLRADVQQAMDTGGQLDPTALARLADFRMVGATPTRGMISQDPVQVTREMNLAKIGANAADDQLQTLARTQNANNATFIRNLNEQGAAQGDAFRAGQSAIGAITGTDARLNQGVGALYQQARDSAGRSFPLDGQAFTQQASRLLDDNLLGGSLPPSVQTHLNRIASGEVPFTVDYAEQLKTAIGNLQRATNDGGQRMALGMVRRALDDTPIMGLGQQGPAAGARAVNPGNLPAIPNQPNLGEDAVNAFNQARQAARQRFAWQESGRPVAAAIDGAQPDKFVQQFVINGTVADARNVAANAPREEVRNAIAAHLKDKALSGAADEIGKFSQAGYNKALNAIGGQKLELFFSPEEITRLRSLGRVAGLAMNQPTGSAVNNSNSGALIIGKALDAIAGAANAIPILGPMVSQPITSGLNNLNIAVRTRQAQNVVPGLLMQQPRPPMAQSLLLPGIAGGGTAAGLLAAP